MPEPIRHPGDIQPGDVFEDCRYHPCFCYDISDDREHVFGVSLVDGSTWQCNIFGCGVRKLTPAEAWRWKSEGPAMELTSASGRIIVDAGEQDIRSVIASEDSADLGIDPHYYIRFAKQKETPCGFVLDYQEGSIAEHYRAVDGPLTLDQVTSAFLKYLRRDTSWQSDFRWERMEF
jgi:hypothetical protein